MKKLLVTCHLSLITLLALCASAQPSAESVLQRLDTKLESMAGYRVDFEVQTDEGPLKGHYEVSGDTYYIEVNGTEVYGTATTRYEVIPANREIVVDRRDLSSRNLLNNPSRAFDFLYSDYGLELQDYTPPRATILLTKSSETILLEVDDARHVPLSVTYHMNGDRLHIDILSVTLPSTAPPSFDRGKYPDYEWIDFR